MATAEQLPARLQRFVSPETRYWHLPGSFRLEQGGALDSPVIAYREWGSSNTGGRTVLICHALTGSADVEEWWPGLIGPSGAFDPGFDRIVCSNILGSCYGTTGPVSPIPGSTGRYRHRFPRVTVRDMVRAQRQLLDALGIQTLDVVVGPSLGGMQALEWAISYPDRVRSIVPIGVGASHSAWCIAMSEAQRSAIYADPDWQAGNYQEHCRPERGLAAARTMGVLSYRSRASFGKRFGREKKSAVEFQVQSYLRHQGRKINERFDANCYVRLTQAMNDFDLARGRGSIQNVLRSITQPALVVSLSSDILYPPVEQAELADGLPRAEHVVIDSEEGHDGFLLETRELIRLLKEFQESLVPAQAFPAARCA